MKINIRLLLVLSITSLLFSCAKSRHKIGDMYKGGYIFKINIFGHGLCAAPKDYAKGLQWGCYGTYVNGAEGEIIGTGKQNTDDMLAGCTTSGILTAAQYCDSYTSESYEDWYLPSINELELMYRELYAQGLGGFKATNYWSSTQNYSLGAWALMFGSGGTKTNAINKSGLLNVRPIRSF
jgi:hypothetical protein